MVTFLYIWPTFLHHLSSIRDGEGPTVTIVYEKSLGTCISAYIKVLDSSVSPSVFKY